MPRMKNAQTGVEISCSDETAARLNGEWRSAGQEKKVEKPAPRKRTAAKSDSND